MRGLVNFFLFVLVTAVVCAGVAGAAYVMADRFEVKTDAHTEQIETDDVTPTANDGPVTTSPAATEDASSAAPDLAATATPRPSATPNVTATPNATSTPAFTVWTIFAQQSVNIRECPAQTCRLIALLRPGTEIHVLDTVDNWHEILLDDGQIGYVATYLTREATPAP
ncbi:SH3 domain-containing protein [Aggregatilinea lenta]|uniref:SH3 domain-containing protein n=1 Tax=Aggregatilinea lenta TaxID=913108 RepID=UPI0013C2C697|nr:SH3 domain-containing protein [Aggregatilinea lenta]